MFKRWIFFVILFLLVATNVAWMMAYLSNAVTVDYMQQEQIIQKDDVDIVKELLKHAEAFNKRDKAFMELSRIFPNKLIKQEGDTIYVNQVRLVFQDSQFHSIGFLNEE